MRAIRPKIFRAAIWLATLAQAPCFAQADLSSMAAAPDSDPVIDAANAGPGFGTAFAGGRLRRAALGVGKSMLLDLPADAGEIVVGDPTVAAAIARTPRKIFILAQKAGQTSIMVMDKAEHRMMTLELSIGRDVGELSHILRVALPSAKIVARTVNDAIILTGEVDSAADMQTALDIAKGFSGAGSGGASGGLVVNALSLRGRDEVMIKVTIAEVERNVAKQLGVSSSTLAGNWGTFTQSNPFSINNGAIANNALNTVTKFGGPWSLTQTLTAFEQNGVAHVLAEPTLTAVSGESAKFTVGGEVPISSGSTCTGTGTSTNCGNNVSYKTYGVTLNFTPVVLSSGRIMLRLATEVSDIDRANSWTVNGVSTPGFRTRRHDTTIEVPSGGSIATAGLIETSTDQAVNGVPGAQNLPVLGQLFRSRDYLRKETELLIIVTPFLAKASPAQAFARPDDHFADANDPQAWLLGRVNRLYAAPSAPARPAGRFGFIAD